MNEFINLNYNSNHLNLTYQAKIKYANNGKSMVRLSEKVFLTFIIS